MNTNWSQSNAIKFTRAGCCARVSLKFSSETVDLVVSDCGYGMSEDFVRHNIYLPFSQQDPVASGMGLGLSLVKRNIDSLGGTVDIETDQELGTTAKISVQTENLAAKADTPKETGGKGHQRTICLSCTPASTLQAHGYTGTTNGTSAPSISCSTHYLPL
jgi:hypothetical protein